MKLKAYLWFVLPVLVIIAWVFAFYVPISAKIKVKEKELVGLRQETTQAENQTKVMLEAIKKGERDKASATVIRKNIPVIDEFPDFTRSLVKLAKADGVVVKSLNSRLLEEAAGPLVTPVFDMGISGGFLQMGKFLNDMEDKAAYRKITKALISYDDKDYPALNCSFTVEFRAWRGGIFESQ